MQKRSKKVVDLLKCHGLAISKTEIEVGRNKKKSSSSANFSPLTTLADFDDLNEELTEQDKTVLRDIDPFFEGSLVTLLIFFCCFFVCFFYLIPTKKKIRCRQQLVS